MVGMNAVGMNAVGGKSVGMKAAEEGRGHQQPLRYDRRLGRGRSARRGAAAGVTVAGRPSAAVLVVPLWERPRAGVRR